MRYIAIDPGLMTGISIWEWERGQEPVLVHSEEVDEDHFAKVVRYWFDNTFPQRIGVICERFVITMDTAKKSQAPFSLELIGQLKLVMKDRNRDPKTEINYQKPSDAMAMFPNPKLKKLGYWHRGGAGHALDSIRHGLLFFVKHGWAPRGLLD